MADTRVAETVPEDIIVEIVTRLPIKSVGRSRCVCKRWCSLFSGTKFAKSHMQLAIERRTLSRRLVVLTKVYESLDLDLGEPKKSSLREGQLNAPFKKQGQALCFLGSCNGLVACCTNKSRYSQEFERLFIWNPSTKFYKEITTGKVSSFPRGVSTRGFGYVSGTNDYKVVLGTLPFQEVIGIFSFRTRTWDFIKSPMFVISTKRSKGVLLGESLHWLAYERDPDVSRSEFFRRPMFVFALNLANKEFRKMQVPSYSKFMMQGSCLGVSCEGCLYMTNHFGGSGEECLVHFWVMREYGNSESWTLSLSRRFPAKPDNRIYRLEPISLMGSCAFVMNKLWPWMTGRDKTKMPAEADMNTVYVDDKPENASIVRTNIVHTDPLDMIVYEESLSEYEEGEAGQMAVTLYVPQGFRTLK